MFARRAPAAMAPRLPALLAQFRMEFSELGFDVSDGEGQGRAPCLSHVLTQGICKGCLVRRPRCLALTASIDKTAKLWSTQTGQCLQTFSGHKGVVNSAVFVPNNPEQILTASADSTLRYWCVRCGRCMKIVTLNNARRGPVDVLSAMISPDGQLLIVNCMASLLDNFTMVSISHAEKPRTQTMLRTEGTVTTAVFSNGGHLALTSSDAGSVMVFDVATAQRRARVPIGGEYVFLSATLTIKHPGGEDAFLSAAFSSDDALIATACQSHVITDGAPARMIDAVQIWSAATGGLLQSVHHSHGSAVRSIEFMADAMQLLTASDDMTAGIWSRLPPTRRSYNHTCTRTFAGHEGCVRSAHFSPDGIWILTASQDRSAKIWCVARGVCLLTLQGHAASLTAAAFSPASRQIDGRRAPACGASASAPEARRSGADSRDHKAHCSC